MSAMDSQTRNVDRLLERYGEFHRNPANKAIHWVCVPLIVWSVLGALWTVSPVAAVRGDRRHDGLLPLAVAAARARDARPDGAHGVAADAARLTHACSYRSPFSSPRGSASSSATSSKGASQAFLEDVRSLLIGPAWLLRGPLSAPRHRVLRRRVSYRSDQALSACQTTQH